MSVISMKQLLEAGVHFGHQTRRWNPKMAPYIYTERNGIYIIDLQKSVGKVDEAYNAVFDIAAQGGIILFVGTKKQAQDAIKIEAERCGMFYVNERWLGGMLTNFKTIQSRIDRLKEIEAMEEDGTFDVLPKKEVIALRKEMEKLQKNLGGIKEMEQNPRCNLCRRSQEGAYLCTGSTRSGYPADRYLRYQLRSRRAGLRDPRKRRRDQSRETDCLQDGRRCCRG